MPAYLNNIDALKHDLGDLLLAWGNLELALAGITSQLLCGSDDRIPLFYTIISNHARGQFLEKCILTSDIDEINATKLNKILKRFSRLNATRNKYVHSTYGPFKVLVDDKSEEGLFISDLTAKPEQSEEFVAKLRPLNAVEIKNHTSAVYTLGLDALALSDSVFNTTHLANNDPI